LPKRGIIPPFGKGRSGGILSNNVAISKRMLIIGISLSFKIFAAINYPKTKERRRK
jgi:hypothetical protein